MLEFLKNRAGAVLSKALAAMNFAGLSQQMQEFFFKKGRQRMGQKPSELLQRCWLFAWEVMKGVGSLFLEALDKKRVFPEGVEEADVCTGLVC